MCNSLYNTYDNSTEKSDNHSLSLPKGYEVGMAIDSPTALKTLSSKENQNKTSPLSVYFKNLD